MSCGTNPFHLADESYNPFSDKFRFHSLYENTPDVYYESLAPELAAFVPEEYQDHFIIPPLTDELIHSLLNKETKTNEYTALVIAANVFRRLGLYEKFEHNKGRIKKYKLVKNKHYCDEVDVLNLIFPELLFNHYSVADVYFERNHRYFEKSSYKILASLEKTLESVANTAFYPPNKKKFPGSWKLRTLHPNISVVFGINQNYDVLRSVGIRHTCNNIFRNMLWAVTINLFRYYSELRLSERSGWDCYEACHGEIIWVN